MEADTIAIMAPVVVQCLAQEQSVALLQGTRSLVTTVDSVNQLAAAGATAHVLKAVRAEHGQGEVASEALHTLGLMASSASVATEIEASGVGVEWLRDNADQPDKVTAASLVSALRLQTALVGSVEGADARFLRAAGSHVITDVLDSFCSSKATVSTAQSGPTATTGGSSGSSNNSGSNTTISTNGSHTLAAAGAVVLDASAFVSVTQLVTALVAHPAPLSDQAVMGEVVRGVATVASAGPTVAHRTVSVAAVAAAASGAIGVLKPEVAQALMSSGVLAQLIERAGESSELMTPEVVGALTPLINTIAQDPGHKAALVEAGVEGVLRRVMAANPTDTVLLAQCARALTTVAEIPPSVMVSQALEKLSVYQGEEEVDENRLPALAADLTVLNNTLLLTGAVGQASAATTVAVLVGFVDTLVDVPKSAARQDALAAAVHGLTRVVGNNRGGLELDMQSIAAAIGNAFQAASIGSTAAADVGVTQAAVHAAATLAESSEESVRMLSESGVIAAISHAAEMDDGPVSAEAQRTMKAMSTLALRRPSVVVVSAGGMAADAVAGMLESVKEPEQLEALLTAVVNQKGGPQALVDAVGNCKDPDVRAHAVAALCRVRAVQGVAVNVESEEAVVAVVKASKREKSAVVLLESACNEPGTCLLLAQHGGVEAVCNVLALAPEAVARAIAGTPPVAGSVDMDAVRISSRMMARLVSKNEQAVNVKLVEAGAAVHMVTAVEAVLDANGNAAVAAALVEEVSQNGLYALNGLCSTVGVENMALRRKHKRIVRAAADAFQANDYVAATAVTLLATLDEVFVDSDVTQLNDKVEQVKMFAASGGGITQLVTEDGRPYFFDRATQATTWTMPQEYADLLESVETLSEMVGALGDDVASLDPDEELLQRTAELVMTHKRDLHVLKAATATAAALARSPANVAILGKSTAVSSLVDGLRLNQSDAAFSGQATQLIATLSVVPEFLAELGTDDRLQTLNEVMSNPNSTAETVAAMLGILQAVTSGDAEATLRFVKGKGLNYLANAMARHRGNAAVGLAGCGALIAVMARTSTDRREVCRLGGRELIAVLLTASVEDEATAMAAVRALGRLSALDSNVIELVNNKAVKGLCKVIRVHIASERAVQVAIEVMSNFAAAEAEEEEEEGSTVSPDPVLMKMGEAGALEAIVDAMVAHEQITSLVLSAMDALINLSNAGALLQRMVEGGQVAPLVLRTMQSQDWDEDVVQRCVQVLCNITLTEEGVRQVAAADGVAALLGALDLHSGNIEVLEGVASALDNFARDDQQRGTIAKGGGAQLMLRLLETCVEEEHTDFRATAVSALTRLCMDDDTSQQVAEKGMHVITGALERAAEDPEVLSQLFGLIGQLAFVPANLRPVVQHGSVGLAIRAVCAHPEAPALVITAVQMLANVASTNEEYAEIVMEEGGRNAITELAAAYKSDVGISRACASALGSLNAAEALKERSDVVETRAAVMAALGHGRTGKKEGPTDPMAAYRAMLTGGAMITEFQAGAAKSRHMFTSGDWQYILLKDPKRGAKSGVRVPLRSVRGFAMGLCDNHKHKGFLKASRVANPDLAWSIDVGGEAVALESPSASDRARWMEALGVLVDTFQNAPAWLR